jgi:hypothetical protein
MSDLAIFLFGFVATVVTLGPLLIAAISELREKESQQKPEPEQKPGSGGTAGDWN